MLIASRLANVLSSRFVPAVLAGYIVFCAAAYSVTAQQPHPLSFNQDIRAILSDACFQCHGPDDAKRQGGLRLDQAQGAMGAGDSGAIAIVSGKVDESELNRRIISDDPSLTMPPPDSGKTLTREQIELLRRWISEGAAYEEHWAFRTVTRPNVPADNGFAHPIDAFVEVKRRAAGLKGQAEADRVTLIRRLTLDLHGIPPTPAEVDAFVQDSSANAYEKLVDRLLASPRYGERMAVQWLDFARYADSNGFQVDSSRFQWPWRDWVIDAFNKNMPFDQFTIEQNAGDLLPSATESQILATGFHRNHKLNGEGGIIAEEWRIETVIDRVETMGLTWLGLTLNCCRCHDHKYDPITQREFYQFFAYYNNVPESGTLQGESRNTEPTLRVVTGEHQQMVQAFSKRVSDTEQELAELQKGVRQLAAKWSAENGKNLLAKKSMWTQLIAANAKSLGGATISDQGDGIYLVSGENPAFDTYEIRGKTPPGKVTGILIECFVDPSLPQQSLGRYPNGNFVLTRVEVSSHASDGSTQTAKVARAVADFSQSGWDIANVVAGAKGKGWAVDGPTKKENRKAFFVLDKPLDVSADSEIVVRLQHDAINQHNIGKFRLSTTATAAEGIALQEVPISALLLEALSAAEAQRSDAQWQEIEKYYESQVEGPIQAKMRDVAAAKKALEDYQATVPTAMVLKEGNLRETFVLKRGQYDLPGDKVERGLPAALPPLPADVPNDRLGLAKWLVNERNPLTARVWVNRAWERFFGNGLVKSSENFGSQADFPSHPELLDYLAAEFMQPTFLPSVGGEAAKPWDMKAIQKFIVMSETYRQASTASAEARLTDPENRWLARGARLRLQGEFIRDSALAVSGLLVEKIGGPSVRPYMPEGVWDETSRYGDLRNYKPDEDGGRYRRSMYTVWKRTAAPPSMLLFDAPNREVCTVKRSRTNTPLQALSLLNEITFIEAARGLAKRMFVEGGGDAESRLRYGFRLVVGREPSESELQVLKDGISADMEELRKTPAAVDGLLAAGLPTKIDGEDRVEFAAYCLAANVLLNLDEFVNRP
jgi:hypothetical protein